MKRRGLTVSELLDWNKGLEADFEAFWRAYPRRVAKLAAWRAYQKARRGVEHARIMEGVRAYARDIAERCTGSQYVAHPATWLNGGRWDDEYGADAGGLAEGIAAAVGDLLDARRRH